MNHTCLFIPSRSWYSFTNPKGWKAELALGVECRAAATVRSVDPGKPMRIIECDLEFVGLEKISHVLFREVTYSDTLFKENFIPVRQSLVIGRPITGRHCPPQSIYLSTCSVHPVIYVYAYGGENTVTILTSILENMEKMVLHVHLCTRSVEANILTDRYRLAAVLNFAATGHQRAEQIRSRWI